MILFSLQMRYVRFINSDVINIYEIFRMGEYKKLDV